LSQRARRGIDAFFVPFGAGRPENASPEGTSSRVGNSVLFALDVQNIESRRRLSRRGAVAIPAEPLPTITISGDSRLASADVLDSFAPSVCHGLS
jgi:hypothetical protein